MKKIEKGFEQSDEEEVRKIQILLRFAEGLNLPQSATEILKQRREKLIDNIRNFYCFITDGEIESIIEDCSPSQYESLYGRLILQSDEFYNRIPIPADDTTKPVEKDDPSLKKYKIDLWLKMPFNRDKIQLLDNEGCWDWTEFYNACQYMLELIKKREKTEKTPNPIRKKTGNFGKNFYFTPNANSLSQRSPVDPAVQEAAYEAAGNIGVR